METGSAAAELERKYGDSWARHYDHLFPDVDAAALDFLEGLVGDGNRALELAVGTGRVAIPLAQRGVAVTGLDLSGEMLKVLDEKSGGAVEILLGDMVDFQIEATFPLVFLVANSLFTVLSQERQVHCFRSVASHLERDGAFVLECFIPDLSRFDEEHRHESERSVSSDGGVQFDSAIHHPELQRIDSEQTWTYPDGSTFTLPVAVRYAWPAELDLMAELAGLKLEERFEWYDRRPIKADSKSHVSVYRHTEPSDPRPS